MEKIDDAFRIMSNLDRDSPLRTSNGHLNTTGVVPSTSIEIPEEQSGPHRVGPNVLDNYEPAHTNYTRGIEITQSTFHGTHHFSIWEFSGYEPYKIVYDQFVGCDDALACIHLVAYSLTQSQTECLRECAMWLEYLRARISTSSASPAVEREPNHVASSRPSLKGVSSKCCFTSSLVLTTILTSPIKAFLKRARCFFSHFVINPVNILKLVKINIL